MKQFCVYLGLNVLATMIFLQVVPQAHKCAFNAG